MPREVNVMYEILIILTREEETDIVSRSTDNKLPICS
jgi:hypothetical protein